MDLAVPLHLNQTNWKQKFDKNGSDEKKPYVTIYRSIKSQIWDNEL